MNEIERLMKTLGLTKEQAQELIKADKEVDKMTKVSDINSDLTEEERKASKKARSVGRTVSTAPTKRTKKENSIKKDLISRLSVALQEIGEIEVTNEEREIYCWIDDTEYKVVLSQPTKPKGRKEK